MKVKKLMLEGEAGAVPPKHEITLLSLIVDICTNDSFLIRSCTIPVSIIGVETLQAQIL